MLAKLSVFKTAAIAAATAATATPAAAEALLQSGLISSAVETARIVRESADNRIVQGLKSDRADGGSIWLDVKYVTDEADTLVANGGFDNDQTVVNLGADIKRGDAFFGVVYTYSDLDSEGTGSNSAYEGKADIFGINAFGAHAFGALSLAASAGWLYVSGDVKDASGWTESNTNIWTFDVAARLHFNWADLSVVPYAKAEHTFIRPRNVGAYQPNDAHLWQLPVGVNLAYTFAGDGWSIRPSVDFAFIKTAGDREIAVYGPGARVEEHDFINSSTLYRAMVGVAASYGKGIFRIGYRYLGSDEGRASHAWSLKANYVF